MLMIESCELPLAREYQEELGDPPGEEMCHRLLVEIKGEFLLMQDEGDKFYYLRKNDCDLVHVCGKHDWCIIHESRFSKELMIGVGLAEPDTFESCIYRVKDYDMRQMWKDILNFVFFKSFSVPSYFLYDSKFKGKTVLDGTDCYYIHDYCPSHCGRVHIEQERARHSVYAFKDGEKPHLWAKIFSLCIGELPAFGKIRDNAVLVPIPASTRERNVQRYARFCRILSKMLKIEDGFRAIWIARSREQLKGTVGTDKLENVEFNARYIRGKDVILCDDVTTTGQSLVQMKRKMMELGAKSVIGVFMARTIET